jgi:four helix bundle protein
MMIRIGRLRYSGDEGRVASGELPGGFKIKTKHSMETTSSKSYEDLIVWQKSITLSLEIYKITKAFPSEERYALVDQMRRASVSIPSNIAEGRSRSTSKDFKHFLHMSLGSTAELDTQLRISSTLGYCDHQSYESSSGLITEVRRMLHGMIRRLDSRS